MNQVLERQFTRQKLINANYGLPYVTASVDVLNQENLIQKDGHRAQASFHFSIFPTASRIQEMNISTFKNEPVGIHIS